MVTGLRSLSFPGFSGLNPNRLETWRNSRLKSHWVAIPDAEEFLWASLVAEAKEFAG